MRKAILILEIILFILFFTANSSWAYRMVDYFAHDEGDILIFDKDLHVTGSETHQFGAYTGRIYLNASTYFDSHGFIYSGSEGILMVGMYSTEDSQYIDLSSYPFKLAAAEMGVNDSVTSTVPGAVFGMTRDLELTVTLKGAESVTVPAGTFQNALKMEFYVIDGESTTYTEEIWLVKGVGLVKVYRKAWTGETEGCFMSCGTVFEGNPTDEAGKTVQLRSFVDGKRKAVVIPLN
jgi:hypothetical protein